MIIPEKEPEPKLKKIKFIRASHPLPNSNGVKGAKAILELAGKAGEKDLVISLISGGGSALMPLPAKGVSLKEKIETTSLLLKCGATIHEINAVRKHLSCIKGGRLAKAIHPARCINLVISDVLGDDLSVIASGPLSPDPSTREDTLAILKKYHLTKKVPASVLSVIRGGEETPKEGDPVFKKIKTKILANHLSSAKAAKKIGGKKAVILDECMEGDCNQTACKWMKKIRNQKGLFILTGETTVQVTGCGKGGRNQQFSLACLEKMEEKNPFTLLSMGTDGVDGFCPEEIAGAIISPSSFSDKKEIASYLENNDSYHFFKKTKGLIKTGPTGTNLGDLVLIYR